MKAGTAAGAVLAAAWIAVAGWAAPARVKGDPTLSPAGVSSKEERGSLVEVNGVGIFYHRMGSGKPLYLIHGGAAIPHTWFHPALDSLADRASVVFFDLRGTGRSGRSEKPKHYTVDCMVDDLDDLRKKLGHEKIRILGHSVGGMIALQYAIQHRDEVERLILVETACSGPAIDRRLREYRSSLPDSVEVALVRQESMGIFGSDGKYRPAYQALLSRSILPGLYFHDPARFSEMPPFEIAFEVQRRMCGDLGELAITGNLREFDVTKKLSKIRCPTLILSGTNGKMTPEMLETLRRGILDSQVAVFEKSGHFPWIEERERFLRVVRDFLNE